MRASKLLLFAFLFITCVSCDDEMSEATDSTTSGDFTMTIENENEYLYRNCEHDIRLSFSGTGNIEVTATATGGDLVKISNELFRAYPDASVMRITFTATDDDSNELVEVKNYSVVEPPAPDITILGSNGRDVDLRNGLSTLNISTFTANVTAEPAFSQFFVKDARYRVSEWKISLISGTRVIVAQTFTGQSADVSSFTNMASSGDRILFEILQVQRMNARSAVENISITTGNLINLPLI